MGKTEFYLDFSKALSIKKHVNVFVGMIFLLSIFLIPQKNSNSGILYQFIESPGNCFCHENSFWFTSFPVYINLFFILIKKVKYSRKLVGLFSWFALTFSKYCEARWMQRNSDWLRFELIFFNRLGKRSLKGTSKNPI